MLFRRYPPRSVQLILFLVLFTLLVCEYLIYYAVLYKCTWIQLADNERPTLKVMFVADTHLLGNRNGHWFDKLRREWQMYRGFQTAISLHQPEVVFFLGDQLDEGDLAHPPEFEEYFQRFKDLFYVPDGTKVYSVAGNHDVGFHYKLTSGRMYDFERKFESPAVRMLELGRSIFVLINSMVLEEDGCHFCVDAERNLNNIGKILRCTKTPDNYEDCRRVETLSRYSRPIVLQHFPLYRQSEESCTGEDSAIGADRTNRMREHWDCLSRSATELIIQTLNPRLVVDGHTHNGCYQLHPPDIHEFTVPSFSWRNRNNPAFLLANISPTNFTISKCYLPQESTVITIYYCAGFLLAALVLLSWRRSVTSLKPITKAR